MGGRTFFFFFFGRKVGKKRVFVDYDALYRGLLKGPLTFRDIMDITGVSKDGVAQVITTMSLRFPVWSPKRGVYKLLEDSDYGQY